MPGIEGKLYFGCEKIEKMMIKYLKLLGLVVVLLAANTVSAQDTVTTWYDGLWKETVEADAQYFREAWQEDGLWMVKDYDKNGSIQMNGSYSSLDPDVRSGNFIYFHENGSKRSEGRYAKNVKVGLWFVWYKDGTLSDKGTYEELDAYPSGTLQMALAHPSSAENDTLSIRRGEWEYFYESGKISSRITWEHNAPVDIAYWEEDGSIPYEEPVLEMMPEFPGGEDALMHFLGTNVWYPEQDKAAGVSGRVVIQFTVEKDGSIADPQVLKSVSPTIDAECIRLVNSMPNWIPGVQNNRPVSVEYTLPIGFKANVYPAKHRKPRR